MSKELVKPVEILTEEEIDICYKLIGKMSFTGLCDFADKYAVRVLEQASSYNSLLSANAELSFEKNAYKKALTKIVCLNMPMPDEVFDLANNALEELK